MDPQARGQIIQWVIMAVVIAIVLAFRLRGMRRARPLKLEHLWIVPALYAVVTAALFWNMPPHGLGWLAVLAALAVGGAIGWWRGTTMRIGIDPETHRLNQQASPIAVLAIVGLILLRTAARSLVGTHNAYIGLSLMTDILVAFALGLLTLTRVEMYLRGKRLLAAAQGGSALA